MKRIIKLSMLIASICCMTSCNTGSSSQAEVNYNVVPLPGEIAITEGTPFTLSGSTKIVYPEGNEKNAEKRRVSGRLPGDIHRD